MQKLLVLGGILAAFCFAPQMLEGSSDACGAVAARVMAQHATELNQQLKDNPFAGLAIGMVNVMGGPIVAKRVAELYPGIPTGIACPLQYWKELVDPSSKRGA